MEEKKIKTYKIMYIPTKNVFELSKTECDKLILEEPNNFKVLDENYVLPKHEEKETTSEEVSILSGKTTKKETKSDEVGKILQD